MTRRVRILEATIRDGGYMVDHHFSRMDLATIVGGLDSAGLPLIEVGHGNGVGSQQFKDPKLRGTIMPLVDDAGHAEVALRVARTARVGVVLTAGKRFAPEEYIERIADLGYAFVRLAVMPDEVDETLFRYVRRVKARGMACSINVMQTYVKTPAQIAEGARAAADHGVDWFYVVDSAGGMLPDEVKRYVEAVLAAAPVEVGLHAHNNLGCAVANAIAAVEAGATLVDGTLNGIGRATGNPATEQLAVALRDRLANEIDLDALVGLGNAVRSLFADTGNESFDFVSGGALMHSRNVPKVIEAARARDRSPSSFLLAVGAEARKRGQLNALAYGDELYDAVAPASAPVRSSDPTPAMLEIASEEALARWTGGAKRAIEDLSLLSRQRHLPSVVHVSRTAAARPVPWQTATVAGVTVPWAAAYDVAPERLPDYVLVDEGDPETGLAGTIATWRIRFADVHARATQELQIALGDRTSVQPKWPAAVARLAESLVELHREHAGEQPDETTPDSLEGAQRAAAAELTAILRGKRRF